MSPSALLDWTVQHKDTLTWLGGGIVTVTGGVWAVVRYVLERKESKPAAGTQVTVQHGNYIAGNVTNVTNSGWSGEQFQEFAQQLLQKSGQAYPPDLLDRLQNLAERAGVSETALKNLASRLGEENVPIPQLGAKLLDRIERLQSALQQSQALPANNPIKPLVEEAAANGAYDSAELLLTTALDQVNAVALIEQGEMLGAKELLQRAELALGTLSKGNSLNYRVAAGFLYKTYEQFYFAQGDQATGNDYLDKALALFKSVASETVTQKDAVIPFAQAIHGMGNVYQGRGQFRDAIRQYEMVVAILPTYAYSWHDMFLCYASLAEQGEVDVAAMRRALKMLEETGKGWRHIDDDRIARLKATLAKYDGSKSPAPN